jgi:hypothetical protein
MAMTPMIENTPVMNPVDMVYITTLLSMVFVLATHAGVEIALSGTASAEYSMVKTYRCHLDPVFWVSKQNDTIAAMAKSATISQLTQAVSKTFMRPATAC